MIAQCNITCGSWGSGLLAFEQLFEMLHKLWIGVGVIIAAWLVLIVVVAIVRKCRGR